MSLCLRCSLVERVMKEGKPGVIQCRKYKVHPKKSFCSKIFSLSKKNEQPKNEQPNLPFIRSTKNEALLPFGCRLGCRARTAAAAAAEGEGGGDTGRVHHGRPQRTWRVRWQWRRRGGRIIRETRRAGGQKLVLMFSKVCAACGLFDLRSPVYYRQTYCQTV